MAFRLLYMIAIHLGYIYASFWMLPSVTNKLIPGIKGACVDFCLGHISSANGADINRKQSALQVNEPA